MLDINKLRKDYDKVAKRIRQRNKSYPQLEEFQQVDQEWRKVTNEIQNLNTQRNQLTETITKSMGQSGNEAKIDQIKKQVQGIKKEIETLSVKEEALDAQLKNILYSIPNIPDDSVPYGRDENDNVEIRKWSTPTKFNFKPLTHWEIAEKLDLADFERATKISGSRHTIFKKDGAKLMRALRDFTLDMHAQAGYVELLPPVLINPDVLFGTGHLPKSEEDMFKTTTNQFLSPTEEVPLTGYYRNEILEAKQLPIWLTSSTLSFRSEAGSAGKDLRGIIRQHQFYNTEMVMLSTPEESMIMLEKMTNQCEAVLKALEIPYRVITLCTGDMGSAALKTYDVEVWFPCNEKYREISSCSNCGDYQARGSMIRYRDPKTQKTEYVHTLNGTGTSLNRLWVAIVENYQQADGSIKIPKALQKYFNNQEFIK